MMRTPFRKSLPGVGDGGKKPTGSTWSCRMPVCLALAFLLVTGGLARAEDNSAEDYRLGPEDVIEITVDNHPDLNKTLTILPNGRFTYVGVGDIKAQGKTQKSLASEIQTALEKDYNNVAVSVAVKEVHSRRARIIGAVHLPNAYDLKPNWHVIDLIAVAGGLSAKSGRIKGTIVRGTNKPITFSVANALEHADGPANIKLEPDDLIYLEEIEQIRMQVHVMGQINRPGPYDLEADMTVMNLLSLAGSTTERAALTRAYIQRGPDQLPLDLRPFLTEGKSGASLNAFKLQPGDILMIPANEVRFAVMGRVGKAGYYPMPERGEMRVLEALTLAGGATSEGDTLRAGIVRLVDGKASMVPVNIDRILKKGDMSVNVLLQPGDVLYVPPRTRHGFGWQDLLSPLTTLSFLGFFPR